MTLTEFLLARIAEDEAPTYELIPGSSRLPAGWVGHWCLICDTIEYDSTVDDGRLDREHEDLIHQHQRVLAECAAKRQIVQDCIDQAAWIDNDPQAGDGGKGRLYCYQDVVRILALPYADHPDYQEVWHV